MIFSVFHYGLLSSNPVCANNIYIPIFDDVAFSEFRKCHAKRFTNARMLRLSTEEQDENY